MEIFDLTVSLEVVVPNGWDAITYPKKLLEAQPSALQIDEMHIKLRVQPNIVYRNN